MNGNDGFMFIMVILWVIICPPIGLLILVLWLIFG